MLKMRSLKTSWQILKNYLRRFVDMDDFLIIFKWVLLGLCSALGLALTPTMPALGMVLGFGCFLVLALDIARSFI